MGFPELVVLLSEKNEPIGSMEKALVHTENTPYHLAFSCYILNKDGHVLITRRALDKKTWPGVWTNSFCGHPGPGEDYEQALVRRAAQELGVEQESLVSVECVLPDFSYRAVDSRGVVEWEFCPVFCARFVGEDVCPQPAEVDSWEWVEPARLFSAVEAVPVVFSPWMKEQLEHDALRCALGV